MSWIGGGEVFETTCKEIIRQVGHEDITFDGAKFVLKALIEALRDRGWDTEMEYLGIYVDYGYVREAFREVGFIAECLVTRIDEEGDERFCVLELGAKAHEHGHQDEGGYRWS